MALLRTFFTSLVTGTLGNVIVFALVCLAALIVGLLYGSLYGISTSWFGNFSFINTPTVEVFSSQIFVYILSVALTVLFSILLCRWRFRCRVPGKFWRNRAERKAPSVKIVALRFSVTLHFFISIVLLAILVFSNETVVSFAVSIRGGEGYDFAIFLGALVCVTVFQFIYWIYALLRFKTAECQKCKAVFGQIYEKLGIDTIEKKYQYEAVEYRKDYYEYNGGLRSRRTPYMAKHDGVRTEHFVRYKCTCAYCGESFLKSVRKYFYHEPRDKSIKEKWYEKDDMS